MFTELTQPPSLPSFCIFSAFSQLGYAGNRRSTFTPTGVLGIVFRHGTVAVLARGEIAGMTEQEVEQLVARVFLELGATKVFDISDTLFIDGGKCLAIAYRAEDLSAVWCFEDGTIEFHDRDGKLLRTLSLPKDIKLRAA
ncbi:MAG: hypothetical protein ABSF26_29415 [Thermoguttaceae bacterium]